tara:strand:+ start:298 stop:438 length:141 start_codon:yes stop_codon:yes gene_type:complete
MAAAAADVFCRVQVALDGNKATMGPGAVRVALRALRVKKLVQIVVG